jgi:hypothetical protein
LDSLAELEPRLDRFVAIYQEPRRLPGREGQTRKDATSLRVAIAAALGYIRTFAT